MKPIALAAIFFLTVSALPPVYAGQARPNILYIMSDDHAAHAISAYGSRINQTPHLDRLARRGHAVRPLFRRQLDLHPQPGRHPDRQVQPHQRRAGVQPLRRLAADRGQVPAGRRLPHRHDRQVAPGQRSDRVSTTGTSCPGQGVYHDPAFLEPAAAAVSSRATSPTSSPTSRSSS